MAIAKQKVIRTPITMRDVAELAKVSQSTVSRVLNGKNEPIPIGEETRQRVLEAVEQLSYQPNLHAGSLRGQKTRMVAIMIADIANPFYHPMVRALQDAANVRHYDVMIANSDHLLDSEKLFVQSVIRRPVDGILMAPYHLTNDDFDELIERTGVVVAAVGQQVNHPQIDVAFGNDEQATHDSIAWLVEKKAHSHIGGSGVSSHNSVEARRHSGFERAMLRAGLETPCDYWQLGDWSAESGYSAMERLLTLPKPPTAVFACNDLMAIGALEVVQQKGLRVPDDVAIVGFDDIPAASWVRPRLTTIAQSPGRMGELLANAMFERIEGEYDGPGRRIEIPLRFVERESA